MAQATPFTELWTTFQAHCTIFQAAETVHCTTHSQALTDDETAVHTTSLVVDTLHWTTAFVESINPGQDFAFWIVSHIHSLKSWATHLTHSIIDWPAFLVVSIAHWTASFVEFANSLPESFICSTHSFHISLTLSTQEWTVFFTAFAHCCIIDSSFCSSATWVVDCSDDSSETAWTSVACSTTASSVALMLASSEVEVSVLKSTALKSGVEDVTLCSSVTGVVVWVCPPEVCTFCSSCVWVITYMFNK